MAKSRTKLAYPVDQGHDGSDDWLVSYADMVTLLFGFFVILYSLSQIDDQRLSAMGKEIAQAFGGRVDTTKSESEVGVLSEARQLRALQMLVAMLNLGDSMEEAVKKIEQTAADSTTKAKAMEALRQKLGAKALQGFVKLDPAKVDEDLTIDLALPFNALFQPGTDALRPEARKLLATVARELAASKDLVAVEVTGHTDGAPPAANARYPDNWALSSARAGAVAQELIRRGVPKPAVTVRGLADLKPLFPEHDAAGAALRDNMAKNRRVEIVVRRSPAP